MTNNERLEKLKFLNLFEVNQLREVLEDMLAESYRSIENVIDVGVYREQGKIMQIKAMLTLLSALEDKHGRT